MSLTNIKIKNTFNWHYPIYVVLFAIFVLLPSVNNTTLIQSEITSKTLFFIYGLMILLTLSTICLVARNNVRGVVRISKIDILLFTILAYIIINRYYIQPHYGLSIRFIELMGLSLLYILLRKLPLKIYPWLLLALLISGIIQGMHGILQLLGYYPSLNSNFNITGSYFNPGPYAGFLASTCAIALSLYLYRPAILKLVIPNKDRNESLKYKLVEFIFNYIPLIGLFIFAVVLPATFSRAACVAVLATTCLLTCVKVKFLKKIKLLSFLKKLILLLTISTVISLGSFYGYNIKKKSADGRMLIWKTTTEIIEENPFFGVGFDRFKAHYMNTQANYFLKNSETPEVWFADNTYYAFNEPLQFFTENGLLGISLILLLTYFIFKLNTKEDYTFLKIAPISIIFSLTIFGLFSYPSQILPIKIIGLTSLALLSATDARKITLNLIKQSNQFNRIKMVQLGIILIFASLIGKVYPWSKNLMIAYSDWKTALNTYNTNQYKNSLPEFESASKMLFKDGDFLTNYGKALIKAEQPKKAIEVLQNAKKYLNTTHIETTLGDAYKTVGNYEGAEIAYQHAANMIPNRFYPIYLLARLYDESKQPDKAKEKALEIMNKDIKIQSTAIKEMRREMKKILKK